MFLLAVLSRPPYGAYSEMKWTIYLDVTVQNAYGSLVGISALFVLFGLLLSLGIMATRSFSPQKTERKNFSYKVFHECWWSA